MNHLNWGILGASNFARQHMAPAIQCAAGARLVAVATSNPEKAAAFTAFAPDLQVHDGYDALLTDPQIDAVYIPLPNHLHVEWSLKALSAGKHVLCEKPMTLRATDFARLIDARDDAGLLAAEGFMIVHHPQFLRARALVQGGEIGELRHVSASFSYFNDDSDNIRNQAEAGGGALPDIGVYVCGAVRFVTGQEPLAVPFARIVYERGVDTFAQFNARFDGFAYDGMISTRLAPRQEVVFHGTKAVLRMTCPFNAAVFDQAELHLETTANSRRIERWPGVNHYQLQVEAFCRAVANGGDYACPMEFSRGTQEMIDMIYAAAQTSR